MASGHSFWSRFRKALRIAAFLGMIEPKVRAYEALLDGLEERTGLLLSDPRLEGSPAAPLLGEWLSLSQRLSREVRELKELL